MSVVASWSCTDCKLDLLFWQFCNDIFSYQRIWLIVNFYSFIFVYHPKFYLFKIHSSVFFLFALFYTSSIFISCRPSFLFSLLFHPLYLNLLPVLAQSSLILHNIAFQPIKQQVQIPLQNRWAQLFLWPLPTSWPAATQSLSQHVSWQTTAALHCTGLPGGLLDQTLCVSVCSGAYVCALWSDSSKIPAWGLEQLHFPPGHLVSLKYLVLMNSNFSERFSRDWLKCIRSTEVDLCLSLWKVSLFINLGMH